MLYSLEYQKMNEVQKLSPVSESERLQRWVIYFKLLSGRTIKSHKNLRITHASAKIHTKYL
jgi:hypothetical protein